MNTTNYFIIMMILISSSIIYFGSRAVFFQENGNKVSQLHSRNYLK